MTIDYNLVAKSFEKQERMSLSAIYLDPSTDVRLRHRATRLSNFCWRAAVMASWGRQRELILQELLDLIAEAEKDIRPVRAAGSKIAEMADRASGRNVGFAGLEDGYIQGRRP